MNEIAVLLKEYRAGNVPAKVERLAFCWRW